MEKITLLSILFLAGYLTATISAQSPRTPFDDFLENSETIVVARCTRSGPVDILGRSRVELAVLHVVTGDPKLSSLSLNLRFRMKPGSRYLIRVAKSDHGQSKPSATEDRETAIPIWDGEKLDELRSLPPRIVVLRTINLRIDDLESIIRRANHELEPLKALKKGN